MVELNMASLLVDCVYLRTFLIFFFLFFFFISDINLSSHLDDSEKVAPCPLAFG